MKVKGRRKYGMRVSNLKARARACARIGDVDGLGIFIVVAGESGRSGRFGINRYDPGNRKRSVRILNPEVLGSSLIRGAVGSKSSIRELGYQR